MGNSAIGIEGNALDAALNPAMLYGSNIHSASIAATPARYGLSELSTYEACYSRNFKYFNTGLRASLYGFDLYKETIVGLTVSASFANNFHAGINVNYHSVSIKNYGSDGTVSIDFGLIHNISKYFDLAVSFVNLNSAKIDREIIDQTVNAGIDFHPIKSLILSFMVENNSLYDPNYNAGIEYKIIPEIALRLGVKSEPEIFFAGLGFNYSKLAFDYAYSFHNILGDTHSFSININFEG